jgi:hypothetical protein
MEEEVELIAGIRIVGSGQAHGRGLRGTLAGAPLQALREARQADLRRRVAGWPTRRPRSPGRPGSQRFEMAR